MRPIRPHTVYQIHDSPDIHTKYFLKTADFKVQNCKDTCRASKVILSGVLFNVPAVKKL